MQYDYEDEFLIKNIEDEKLTRIENTAIREVDKLNVTDMYYFEKLVILNVYIQLVKYNFEADGMKEKHTILLDEYNSLLKELKEKTTDATPTTIEKKPSVKSIKLFRG